MYGLSRSSLSVSSPVEQLRAGLVLGLGHIANLMFLRGIVLICPCSGRQSVASISKVLIAVWVVWKRESCGEISACALLSCKVQIVTMMYVTMQVNVHVDIAHHTWHLE
jgi:hypothetical protein